MPPQDNPQDQSTNTNPQPIYGAPEPTTTPEPAMPAAAPDFSVPAAPVAEPTSPYSAPAAPDFSAPVTPPADPVAPTTAVPAESENPETPGPVVS
jgi:hypothetical protein